VSGCNLNRARLVGANLSGGMIERVSMVGTRFADAWLEGCRWYLDGGVEAPEGWAIDILAIDTRHNRGVLRVDYAALERYAERIGADKELCRMLYTEHPKTPPDSLKAMLRALVRAREGITTVSKGVR
jgi:hypothetical protein